MTKYKCGICGKEYESVKERAACELACAEKAEKVAEEKRRKRLEAEKDIKSKAINDKLSEVIDLMVEYQKDYKEDPHIKVKSNGIDIDWSSKTYNSTFERKTPHDILTNRLLNAWLNIL